MKSPRLSVELVAKEIENCKQDIIDLFEKKLKERVEPPYKFDREIMSHVIPSQIERIVESLKRYTSKKGYELTSDDSLKIMDNELPLEIIISEYITLKDVIFEVLQSKGEIDSEAISIIWRYIIYSIQEEASRFERNKVVEVDKISHDLEDSDSTNRKISNQIIHTRQNEERYKTLVDGIEDYAVFTIDPFGYILSWNPGAVRMKGYSVEEVLGKHFSMLYTDEGKAQDAPMDHLHVALIEGRYRGEGMRKRKNGKHFLADVYIRPIYEGGKHLGFAKVVADLTEKNDLLQAANLSQTKIVDLEVEKHDREVFVSRLAHDLRGPLSVARAAVELVRKDCDSKHSIRFTEKALLSIDRMNKMIGDLLDANRISAGKKQHLKLQNWDLVRLTKTVCDDFNLLSKNIHIHSDKSVLPGIWDGESLRRMLENLLSNAIKHGDTSRPIDVYVSDLGNTASLSVHNFGEVIRIEEQKALFSHFHQTTSGKKKNGWGIGLSLVKGVTEAHGGTVEVESYPKEGTTFTVILPKKVDLSNHPH